MKKILTASLVAMMAVTAANANIASTEYIADKVLGGELSTLSTTAKTVVPAINELKTAVTDAGSAASGALDAAKTELEGKITAEAEAREAADTELDGKITALDNKTTGALALKEDIANRVVVDGDIVEGKENSQYPTIAYLELTTKNITDGVAGNLSEMEQSIEDLGGELDTAVEDLQNADATNLQAAKDYAVAQDATQTTTITNAYTAAIKTETDARTAKDTELQNAINAINNSESGILAEAKEYADTKDAAQTNTITTAYTSAIATAKSGAETTAMNYTDEEIAKINSADTGILKQAKDYTDAEVKELADGTVASNTAAINAINNAETGILAKANKHSDDADTAQTTALQQYADKAEADAIAAAKAAGDSAYAAKSYEARVEGNETGISGIKTNLGPLDVKIPAACAAGETCSLVMKKGQVAWEVISY